MEKTLCSQCKGPRFRPWSGKQIPHATTKDPACCSAGQRPCVPQLRPRAAKQTNTFFKWPKDLDTFPKKKYKWPTATWMFNITSHKENKYKSKPKWGDFPGGPVAKALHSQ